MGNMGKPRVLDISVSKITKKKKKGKSALPPEYKVSPYGMMVAPKILRIISENDNGGTVICL